MSVNRVNPFGVVLSDDILDNAHLTPADIYADKSRHGSRRFGWQSRIYLPSPINFIRYLASEDAVENHGAQAIADFKGSSAASYYLRRSDNHSFADDEIYMPESFPGGQKIESRFIFEMLSGTHDLALAYDFHHSVTALEFAQLPQQVGDRNPQEVMHFMGLFPNSPWDHDDKWIPDDDALPLTMYELSNWYVHFFGDQKMLDKVTIGELANTCGMFESNYSRFGDLATDRADKLLRDIRGHYPEDEALLWAAMALWGKPGDYAFIDTIPVEKLVKGFSHAGRKFHHSIFIDYRRAGVHVIADMLRLNSYGRTAAEVEPYTKAGIRDPETINSFIASDIDAELAARI